MLTAAERGDLRPASRVIALPCCLEKLTTSDAGKHDREHRSQKDKAHRHGSSNVPIQRLSDVEVNEIRDHEVGAPTEQRRRHKHPQRKDHAEKHASEHTWHAKWERHVPKNSDPSGTHDLSCAAQVRVLGHEACQDREHHEGQQEVRHPDNDPRTIEEEFDPCAAAQSGNKHRVDETIMAKQHRESEALYEDASPE